MSYFLYGGILLVIGVVLWAAGETWIEMRRYKREARETDAKLAAAIESSTLHTRETQVGDQPHDQSRQVVQHPASVPETGQQRKVRRAS
jgi:hypothetical protein